VQQYLQKTPIDYPVLIGEQGASQQTQQFGVQAVLPFSVFADSTAVSSRSRLASYIARRRISSSRKSGRWTWARWDDEAREAIEGHLRQLAVERAKSQQSTN